MNRKVIRFSELIKYKFDRFIELYDYEECEKIFEEDDLEVCSGTGGDY